MEQFAHENLYGHAKDTARDASEAATPKMLIRTAARHCATDLKL